MSDDQEEALDGLRNFVDFAYKELVGLRCKKQHRRKKNVLLPMYINACDLADSTYLLLKNEKVNTSQNLIRILQETLINMTFICLKGGTIWVDTFLMESEHSSTRFVNGVRFMREKYPSIDSYKSKFNENRLSKIERSANKSINTIKSKYDSLAIPSSFKTLGIGKPPFTIRQRARIIDIIAPDKTAKQDLEHSYEWDYITLYGLLSDSTHVGARYLRSNYLHFDEIGRVFTKHGDKNDIQRNAWTAYGLLFDITSVFYKQFDRSKISLLKPYLDNLNAIRNKLA